MSREALLEKINASRKLDHEKVAYKAQIMGKPIPPEPAPLTLEQIEYPKWLHKGWVETDKAPGHYEPTESKLAHTPEEAEKLKAKGFYPGGPGEEQKQPKPKEAWKKE